jgi:flavin-dependent dehydrogenase
MRDGRRQLVVIGAGFAGLACARAAAQRGVETTVLEAQPEPGHRVSTTGILVKEAADAWAIPRSLLVGDAAGWVSPLTAGGIHTAIEWGRLAGIAVADHLLDGGPLPHQAMRRSIPSFRCKRWLRRAFDLDFPNPVYDRILASPLLRQLARLVFFHHRGVMSREAWRDWLDRVQTASSRA